jgi:hypothetical protein
MISLIIDMINKELEKSFDRAKIYGLAQSIIRTQGNEQELLPALVDHSGDGVYVGFDDQFPLMIYHKMNSLVSALSSQQGFGNAGPDQVNTYQNTMIVYLDRKKLKKLPDEVYMLIQSVFPEGMNIEPFKRISIRFSNVILNSTQVFASEYQGNRYKLPPEKNLFAINYTIESIFKKGCFDKCL